MPHGLDHKTARDDAHTKNTNVQQCVVINSDIGNVPTGGIGISWNFSMEQFFYNHPEEH